MTGGGQRGSLRAARQGGRQAGPSCPSVLRRHVFIAFYPGTFRILEENSAWLVVLVPNCIT